MKDTQFRFVPAHGYMKEISTMKMLVEKMLEEGKTAWNFNSSGKKSVESYLL